MKQLLFFLLVFTLHSSNIFAAGNKVLVLVESKYDSRELDAIMYKFPQNGLSVELASYLWGRESLTFTDIDGTKQIVVTKDVGSVDINEYRGIILIGGYAMDRLRYEANPISGRPNNAPAVALMRKVFQKNATSNDKILVGAICHSLMLLTVDSRFLKGRTVTAANNIIYDVINAGGKILYKLNGGTLPVVMDDELITASHPDYLDKFIDAFIRNAR